MADFSFSFDSDNPFAESEQSPKKAAVSPDEIPVPGEEAGVVAPPTPASNAPVTNAPVTDVDEFSLDSFDFAFDEGSSINDTLPTRTTPIDEVVPRKLTPGEAAFAEFNFNTSEGYEAPASATPASAKAEVRGEPKAPEIETPTELEIPAEFDAIETEAPTKTEITTQGVELLKTSARSTTSDLEEFNALAFDFGPAGDEMFAEESDGEAESAELDRREEPVVEEFVPAQTIAEEPVAEEFVVEEPVAEKLLETPTIEMSAEGADLLAEPDTELNVPDAVAAAETLEAPFEEVAPWADPVSELSVLDAVPAAGMLEKPVEIEQGQTEGEFRRLKTKTLLSVAILGASGIGKNHARWFHRHGCRIAGFLGTSNDSTAQTEADLSADFDFQGTAYTDLETLLQTEKPDIVCVATPPPLHFGHVLQSLEAGAHVLCEKPLVYAPTRKFRENRDGAKELVKVAAKKNLNLGTQLQYGAATPILCKLVGLTATDVGDFAMELETLNPNSPRDPRELWIDLGPHPVSVAQVLAGPGAHLAEETFRFEPYQDDEKTEVLARFGINCADGRLLMVRAVVRALRGEITRKPRRRFAFNGHSISYAPLVNARGEFKAQFVAPDGYSSIYSDPVDYLIGNFVSACRNGEAPLITGDFGRENLEWMLKVGTPGETR